MLQAFKTAGIGITTYSRQESVNIERFANPFEMQSGCSFLDLRAD